MTQSSKAEILKRLNKFLASTGWSNREIGNRLYIREQHINKYLKGKLNITRLSPFIYEAGCSIDWLYSGKGDMFAHNQAGTQLKEMILTGRNLDFDTKLAKAKILEWVKLQHSSLDEFIRINGLDSKEIHSTLYGEKHFLPSLINIIVSEGCNPKWIYGFSKNRFSKSQKGLELAEKARMELLDEIYNDTGIDMRKKISEPSPN